MQPNMVIMMDLYCLLTVPISCCAPSGDTIEQQQPETIINSENTRDKKTAIITLKKKKKIGRQKMKNK